MTLDGVERKLTNNDLMICSGNKPLCLAGIYGGLTGKNPFGAIGTAVKNIF